MTDIIELIDNAIWDTSESVDEHRAGSRLVPFVGGPWDGDVFANDRVARNTVTSTSLP